MRFPSSLMFALGLLGCGVVAALTSAAVQYREKEGRARTAAHVMTGGDSEAGRATISRYGCGACHTITGVPGADGTVGPDLRSIATQSLIAGKLSNTPDNLVLWISHPQHVSPGTGMPEQPMTDSDARNIAAYLYTLRRSP